MPLFMGMGLGVNNAATATNMLPSLMGHLVYGAVLGLTYALFENARNVPAARLQSASSE